MQKFVLTCLILLVVSKEIQFAQETPHDITNNQFEITKPNSNFIFAYVTCQTSNNLNVDYVCGNSGTGSIGINKPGEGFLIQSQKQKVTITISHSLADLKDSGVIWVNPESNEINVDLNKKYEIKIPIIYDHNDLDNYIPKLTYVINKAEKDVTFKFNYEEKVKNSW